MNLAEEPAPKKGKYMENFNVGMKFIDSEIVELSRIS